MFFCYTVFISDLSFIIFVIVVKTGFTAIENIPFLCAMGKIDCKTGVIFVKCRDFRRDNDDMVYRSKSDCALRFKSAVIVAKRQRLLRKADVIF